MPLQLEHVSFLFFFFVDNETITEMNTHGCIHEAAGPAQVSFYSPPPLVGSEIHMNKMEESQLQKQTS